MTVDIRVGDCRELLRTVPDNSIDSAVMDPPYELTSARPGGRSPATQGKVMKGFMGMQWDGSGVAFQVETWAEVYRVLKPGAHLLAFSGARTYHRMACAIEDAGFEIRDQIMWIYGSGMPKGGNRDGKGTCLKPAHEPIVVARKPLIGTVAMNEARYGTGAINIDACRVPTDEALRAGAGVFPMRHDEAVPRGRSGEASADRRYNDRGGADFAATPGPRGGDPLGRWPANVIHDGSQEVLDAFPDAPGQLADLKDHGKCRQSPNGIFGGMRPALDHAARGDTGSAARFFYCPKASKADRDVGMESFEPQAFIQYQTGNGESGEASSWSEGRDTRYRNIHPTVKPTPLMRYLCRLYTPPGGTILDAFMGSGSTGRGAVLEGYKFLGLELTEEYVPIARARIAAAVAQVEAERVAAARAAAAPFQHGLAL